MAELSGPRPPQVPRVLRVLPVIAVAVGVVGLFDHAVGAVAALVAIGAVAATTLLRLALEVRGWRWPADTRFLLATIGLVLIIVAGALLGLRS